MFGTRLLHYGFIYHFGTVLVQRLYSCGATLVQQDFDTILVQVW